ncbi:hypothetical protein HELRODRAFT_154876 [Helobdella robusta]|uniref:UDP-glucuronosyltransferase n=1 Tax=Helobdella robusta TaxID=6412 RepID=T1ELG3_HELRO|nr:hypothetical protein HELRODRAFT_154876 [Helobdella robusta]ESO01585.1 hypothetical protein HELRODRAFT_154876 [Helobdella robusta]
MLSHVLEQVAAGKVLLKAGHEVHLILDSRFDPSLVKKFQNDGFRLHFFKAPTSFVTFSSEEYKKHLGDQIFNANVDFYTHLAIVGEQVNEECGYMLEDKKFIDELKDVGFDLAIPEPFAVIMCPLIIPKYLKIPFVSLTNLYFAFQIRSPALPTYYLRHFQTADDKREMSFFVRFKQLLVIIFFSSRLSPLNRNLTLLHKYAPEFATWDELLRESLLFFYEVDHHFTNFLPAFPNHISVAGLTCSPAKPPPENILNFINSRIVNGKDPGVIVMTFGSSADYMPRGIVKKFFNVFSQLNETIIAKFTIKKTDKELLALVPPNLLILNWLPQNDLLGHPSTKLFITHCGNNGQHEALYHGVPMLGFPLFAEQHMNARRMTVKGFGLGMNILTFTESDLLQNILEIEQNPNYRSSIKLASKAFRDQPMTAQERILFWIEHVIKHGGAHLRSGAMDLPLYQFLCFDTVGTLLLIVIVIIVVTLKLSVHCVEKFIRCYKIRFCKKKEKEL